MGVIEDAVIDLRPGTVPLGEWTTITVGAVTYDGDIVNDFANPVPLSMDGLASFDESKYELSIDDGLVVERTAVDLDHLAAVIRVGPIPISSDSNYLLLEAGAEGLIVGPVGDSTDSMGASLGVEFLDASGNVVGVLESSGVAQGGAGVIGASSSLFDPIPTGAVQVRGVLALGYGESSGLVVDADHRITIRNIGLSASGTIGRAGDPAITWEGAPNLSRAQACMYATAERIGWWVRQPPQIAGVPEIDAASVAMAVPDGSFEVHFVGEESLYTPGDLSISGEAGAIESLYLTWGEVYAVPTASGPMPPGAPIVLSVSETGATLTVDGADIPLEIHALDDGEPNLAAPVGHPTEIWAFPQGSDSHVEYQRLMLWDRALTGVEVSTVTQAILDGPTPEPSGSTLTWSAPIDGGSPITGYVVFTWDGTVVNSHSTTDMTFEIPDGTLMVRVMALNAQGYSAPVDIVTP